MKAAILRTLNEPLTVEDISVSSPGRGSTFTLFLPQTYMSSRPWRRLGFNMAEITALAETGVIASPSR